MLIYTLLCFRSDINQWGSYCNTLTRWSLPSFVKMWIGMTNRIHTFTAHVSGGFRPISPENYKLMFVKLKIWDPKKALIFCYFGGASPLLRSPFSWNFWIRHCISWKSSLNAKIYKIGKPVHDLSYLCRYWQWTVSVNHHKRQNDFFFNVICRNLDVYNGCPMSLLLLLY
jgi:hypothetical protein